jgi:hypothetical protein
MNNKRKWCGCLGGMACLGFLLTSATGCQTNVAGMTLPSGHYQEHLPQYIPPSPPYPLPNELARQQQIAAQPAPDGAGPLPRPVPGAIP